MNTNPNTGFQNTGLNQNIGTTGGLGGTTGGLAGGQIPSTYETQNLGGTTTYAASGPTPGVPGAYTTTYVQSSNTGLGQGGLGSGTGNTVNDPNHPPNALKGNITAMMGKMQHNPQKQLDGNMMVANSCEQKAIKFENKALQWEQKGNVQKAQKNREKAIRYRQKAAAKLNQPLTQPKNTGTGATNTSGLGTTGTTGAYGTTGTGLGTAPYGTTGTGLGTAPYGTTGTTGYGTTGTGLAGTTGTGGGGGLFGGNKADKANRCDQKALEYERKGNLSKAQRNRERAWKIREKNNIPQPAGTVAPLGYTQATTTQYTSATGAVPVTAAR